LRWTRIAILEFDGNCLSSENVLTGIDLSKGTGAKAATKNPFGTDAEIHEARKRRTEETAATVEGKEVGEKWETWGVEMGVEGKV
jgi:hypothetical protein